MPALDLLISEFHFNFTLTLVNEFVLASCVKIGPSNFGKLVATAFGVIIKLRCIKLSRQTVIKTGGLAILTQVEESSPTNERV